MAKNGINWHKMTKNGKKWQKWQKMAKIAKIGKNAAKEKCTWLKPNFCNISFQRMSPTTTTTPSTPVTDWQEAERILKEILADWPADEK